MTATPQSELKTRLGTLDKYTDSGEIDPADAEAILAFIGSYNPNDLTATPPGEDSTLSTGTCNVYLSRLTETGRNIRLADADAEDVNEYLQSLMDDGLSPWSVDNYSKALRRFYGFIDGGPEPEDIATVDTPRGATFDPDDVLSREQVHQMLDAAENPHDRAVFALLIYTGMRNAALRHLRVKDVDPQAGTSGEWKFNREETDGLKGADKRGKRRPLLGAKRPVADWLDYHPTDDPEHYLITGQPRYGEPDPTSPVHGSTIRRVVDRLAEDTGDPEIQRKPTHPHMMRHNFVTACKRDYRMDNDTIRWLLGHAPSSRVMETTYSHLSDDDFIADAEMAAGYRDPDEGESALVPMACSTCGAPLSPNARACERCGDVYGPDAVALQGAVEDINEDATEVGIDATDPGLIEAARALRDATDDPEAVVRALRALDAD